MRLLLASNSTARRAMLADAGVAFEIVASDADEDRRKTQLRLDGAGPAEIALALAYAKAAGAPAHPDDIVIGGDQILELEDGNALDKPRSREELVSQLSQMSGRTHRLHSAAVGIRAGQAVWQAMESAAMTMRPLGPAFLADYVAREYEAVRWNVGGYRIEGPGVQLFEQIEGSHFAILGLPLLPLLAFLRGEGLVAS